MELPMVLDPSRSIVFTHYTFICYYSCFGRAGFPQGRTPDAGHKFFVPRKHDCHPVSWAC